MNKVIVEVSADGAFMYVDRATGEVLRHVYTEEIFDGAYDSITKFNPLHPALLCAEAWDEIPLHKLQLQVEAVA